MKKDINFDDVISYYKKRQEEAKKNFIKAKENKQDAIIEGEEITNLGNMINLFQNSKSKLNNIESEYNELQEKLDSFKKKISQEFDFTNDEEIKNKVDSIEKEISASKEQFAIDRDNRKMMDTIQPLTEQKEILNQELRNHTIGNIVKKISELDAERENIIRESNENLPDEAELFKSSAEDEIKRIDEYQERAKEEFLKDHDRNKYMETVQPLTERKESLNQEIRRINANNYTESAEEVPTITQTTGEEQAEEIPTITPSVGDEKTEEVLIEGLDRLEYMSDEEFIRYSLKDKYTKEEIDNMIGNLKIVPNEAYDDGYDNPISKVDIVRNTDKEIISTITQPVGNEETEEVLIEGLDRLEYMSDEEFIRYSLKDKYTKEEIDNMIGDLKIVPNEAYDDGYDNPISKVDIVRTVRKAKEKTNDEGFVIAPDKKGNFKGKISDIKPISLTPEEIAKLKKHAKDNNKSADEKTNDDDLIIEPDKKSNFRGKISDIKPIPLTPEAKEKINNYRKNKELKGKKWRKALTGAAGFAAGVGLNVVAGSVPVVGTALTVYAAGRTLYNTAKLVNKISTKLNHGEEPKIITSIKNKIPDKVKVACEKIFDKPKNPYAKWFVNGMSIGYLADKVFDISGHIGKAFDSSNAVVPDSTPTPVPTETAVPIDNQINNPIKIGDSIDVSTAEYGYVDSLGDGYTHLIPLDGFGKVDQIINVDGQNMYSILQPNGQGYAWFTEEQVNDMINAAAKTSGRSLQ